jgi:hypothetical protein
MTSNWDSGERRPPPRLPNHARHVSLATTLLTVFLEIETVLRVFIGIETRDLDISSSIRWVCCCQFARSTFTVHLK